jgi:hypothetical protein
MATVREEGDAAAGEERGRWLLVAHPDGEGDLAVPAEALAVAPAAVRDAREGVLVRDPREGRCRLCGRTDRLTREHVPPASAQVGGPVVVVTVEEWLARSPDGALSEGTAEQAGVWTRGLCASCNTTTGSWYGEEYRRWVGRAMGVLQGLPPLAEMDAQDRVGQVRVRFLDVDPGAFVRQVLSFDVHGQRTVGPRQ